MHTRGCVPTTVCCLLLLLCPWSGVRCASDEGHAVRGDSAGLPLGERVKPPPETTPREGFAAADSHADVQTIERWIELLGSGQYALRQRAESALLQLGADAFDQLKSVEHHPDLEVATRARYILGQMKIEWVHAEDPASIRQWMAHYGELSEANRLDCIARLAALDDPHGLGVLSRIARFDPSPLLSREAALEVIRKVSSEEAAAAALDTRSIVQELGRSHRRAVAWIRTCLGQRDPDHLGDSAIEVDRWTRLVDAEMQLLGTQSTTTDEEIVLKLLHHQLDLCQRLQQSSALVEVLERVINLYVRAGESSASGLAYALDWVLQSEQWQVLDRLVAKYGAAIKAHRELLYRVAAIRAKQGQNERATELANRAFHLETDDVEDRNGLASQLVEMDHIDWAEREWRYVTQSFPVLSDEAMTARTDLSMWLHDRLRYLEAAKLLQEIEDEIRADPQQEKQVLKDPQQRFQITVTSARKEYYFACHAESQGDYVGQRAHLSKAVDRYEIDADVLIAMYRLKGADKAYRQETLKRIKNVSMVLSQQIREYPKNTSLLNHWAWLIASTEGDTRQALAYSRASLKWQPGEASFLDTYARCLYATGDLEGALKQQRKAAQLDPHVHALKRQLAFFEQEMASRKQQKENSS